MKKFILILGICLFLINFSFISAKEPCPPTGWPALEISQDFFWGNGEDKSQDEARGIALSNMGIMARFTIEVFYEDYQSAGSGEAEEFSIKNSISIVTQHDFSGTTVTDCSNKKYYSIAKITRKEALEQMKAKAEQIEKKELKLAIEEGIKKLEANDEVLNGKITLLEDQFVEFLKVFYAFKIETETEIQRLKEKSAELAEWEQRITALENYQNQTSNEERAEEIEKRKREIRELTEQVGALTREREEIEHDIEPGLSPSKITDELKPLRTRLSAINKRKPLQNLFGRLRLSHIERTKCRNIQRLYESKRTSVSDLNDIISRREKRENSAPVNRLKAYEMCNKLGRYPTIHEIKAEKETPSKKWNWGLKRKKKRKR